MRSTPSLPALATLAMTAAIQACAAPPPPAPDLAAIEAEVRGASDALVAAEMAKDLEAALTFWAPDAVVHPANQPMVQGMDGIRGIYEWLFAESTGLVDFEGTPTAIHVAASGDLAWEYGVNRMLFETPDGPMTDVGKYLGVWAKRDGTWKVVALAFSSDAPPPAGPDM